MAFSIDTWNVSPNRPWFVKLSDSGSNILCELFLTESDADAGTNRQASGACGYGSGLQVVLAADPEATVTVEYFQSAYAYHLKASGAVSDVTKIFRLAEFVELDEISHPIYRNDTLITTRATAEIDAHTHATIRKEIALGSHLPTLEPGDIVRLNSTRRGKDELLQVSEHRITFETSEGGETSLTSTLSVAKFLELKR